MPSPYEILQVSPQACDAVIRAAYRCLVQRWHPDRNPDERACERLSEINQAYALLADPMKRARFDRQAGIARPERRGTGIGRPRPAAAAGGASIRTFVFRKLG